MSRPGAADLIALLYPHTHEAGGVSWRLTAEGISIGTDKPVGTPGEPLTVRRVWAWFGPEIRMASRRRGVPVELLIATICAESAGGQQDIEAVRTSRREEPGWVSDETTPNRVSVGVMQTLISTAREITGLPLTAADLLVAGTSIDAGAQVIVQATRLTRWDPPLVAAAYNAGALYHDPSPANRWRLRCYPIGTGAHIDRFVAWFCDAMVVGVADRELAGDAPSLAIVFPKKGATTK